MNALSDAQVRRRALDPNRSFIVQAPAGSGKTELLIQRYLRLLAGVSEPEQILAITFTRKAAAEMRARVLAALRDAAAKDPQSAPHRQQTRELAYAALARDAQRDWNLLANPQRMRIGTLDAFNTALAMHLPLLSGGTGGSEICDDAPALYREAARRTVESIWHGDDTDSRQIVFAELDYDTATAERLIAGLLEQRDQWVHRVFDIDAAIAASADALDTLQNTAVARVMALTDERTRQDLAALTQHASRFAAPGVQAATAGIAASGLWAQWRATASLFLTRDGAWRSRFTKTEGFGPDFGQEKARLKAVLERVSQHTELAAALHALRALPEAATDDAERPLLKAIADVLRHAVAELRVLFAGQRRVDFTELGLAARYALGHTDAPSELLLALDRRIQHILVDEFQDTSVAQNDLLATLTAGWDPADGRTLFLVGDPMQSIYRFRNADMSLFIAARKFGIGAIHCEPLTLSANFRSAPVIVDWVNQAFSRCFPDADDLLRGIAAFSPGTANRDAARDQFVHAHALDSESLEDEHAAVLEIIQAERDTHPQSGIAILVRSRSHLAGFRGLLQQHGWRARAVEIDAPYTSQAAQDLIGLARSLTHVGDRLAWLALLRAPWCGLRWAELEALVGDDTQITVWEAMHDPDRLARLDAEARSRLQGLRSTMARALQRRSQRPFIEWLEETWRDLGGPQCLAYAHDETETEDLFNLFELAMVDQDIHDVAELEDFFRQPLKQADSAEPGIDIMTIHRAKGLEFDCVVVPGLARLPRGDERRLLEWFDAYDDDGTHLQMIAPLRQRESRSAGWIRARNREKGRAEVARLMYVAATRARHRLHLVWGLEADRRPPDAALLAPVWPVLEATPVRSPAPADTGDDTLIMPLRRRIEPLTDAMHGSAEPLAADQGPAQRTAAFPWTASTAASVGIVVHEWLQTMCEQTDQPWTPTVFSELSDTFAAQLALLGVSRTELSAAANSVVQALNGVIADPRGRWIIGQREAGESEVMLSSVANGYVVHQRLDRTFVDAGVRWIVDYKTSVSDDDIDAFLDAEVERYRPQLEGYAQFMAQRDTRPIRLGLYFPMLPAFRDWPAAVTAQTPAE